MTSPSLKLRASARHLAVSLSVLLAASSTGFAQQAVPPPATEPKEDEPILLSPFVVDASKDQGYFAQNTLAGSRLNTNISDLGASISVITKQQMQDTASVDINDVFRYEINTEGSSTYTPAGANNLTMRNDGVRDTVAGATLGNGIANFTNASANRVRGLGVPSSAINYYPAIGAIPMDSYNVQSIEISRGPNSMLFGLGSPAGIVNQTTAQAVLNRTNFEVGTRIDHNGSYRGNFSVNQSLVRDKLALYVAAVYDHREFERDPAYDKTKRAYAALTFKPFEKTVIRANVEGYHNDNRRPNSLTPRDFVTEWNTAGQPFYDPLTSQVRRLSDNQHLGTYVFNASSAQANEVRTFIESRPGFNPALWNTARTTYNGVSIFGDAALTNSVGFNAANNTPSTNALFVPGIAWTNQARSTMQIANGQLQNWFQPLRGQRYRTQWGTAANPAANADLFPTEAAIWANPTWSNIYNRGYTASAGWSGIGNNIIGYKYPGVTNKAIYDWENVNVNQMNFGEDKNTNYNIEIEQQILENLFLNAGWFRQDYVAKSNYTVAQLNVTTLFVDTTKTMPDGTANPYFGKVFVEDQDPDRYIIKSLDDHYRAMLAWTPDFTRKDGWLRWLGRHQVLGLWSRDDSTGTGIRERLNYLNSTTFAGQARYMANQNNNANGTPTGWNFQTTSLRRHFYLAEPGDPNGVVTRGSGEWDHRAYSGDIKVYDYANSRFDTVNMTTIFNPFDAHTGRTQREIESLSAGMTNYLWNDRLVTTLGVRRDDYRARSTSNAVVYRQALSTGDASKDVDLAGNPVPAGRPVPIAPAMTNPEKWVNGAYQLDTLFNRWNRWDEVSGTTKTLGGVLRPFKNWNVIDQRADSGSQFWQFVRSFGLSYNQSDNFNPPPSAQYDAFGVPLPKPTGEGKDYGFQFSLFDDKLFARVTWFEASNQNERTSSVTGIARLTGHMDTTAFRNWARTIVRINMGDNPTDSASWDATISPAKEQQIQAAVEAIWQQPYTYYDNISGLGGIGATQDAEAKGIEAEINYNPTRNWTMKLTFGKQDTKYDNVLKQFDDWYAERAPIWAAARASTYLLPQYQSFATYTTSGGRQVDLTNFATSHGYVTDIRTDHPDGWTNVTNYYNIVVLPQVLLNRELEGQSAPGQRKYRSSLLTTYNFTEGKLQGFFVGGSQRWESKSIIGYYGKVSGANGTQIDVSDTSRPIHDEANFYTDIWLGYRRPIMNNKVDMKIQLNVANVFEGGGLQPVSVNLDGSPYAFRIVDPRQFVLTTTFSF